MKIDSISEIRGIGLMMGFEIAGLNSGAVAKKAAENGLLVLTAKSAVRFLPPLTITKEEIDKGIGILKNTVEKMKQEEKA
jgi:acetylornithine/N-succinyldiaminopimelate aminotransferase